MRPPGIESSTSNRARSSRTRPTSRSGSRRSSRSSTPRRSSSSTASRSSTTRAQADELLADRGRRRADRHRDRDPLGPRRDLRRRGERPARAPHPAVRARRAPRPRPGRDGHPPVGDYLDQRIIDTPHYHRLERDLGWVAQRNNTWSLHVHVGVRGADRAIAVCDHLREPAAAAARDLGQLALPRRPRHRPALGPHRDLHPDLPALRRPRAVRRLGQLRGLRRPARATTSSIVESTQLWWSVRPHHRFGTVEVRICDAQTGGDESFALAELIAACIAQSALDYDDGGLPAPLRQREIEENLWRAIRYGMDGKLIDFAAREEIEAREALERLLAWTAPAREALGVGDPALPEQNGAQRARGALADGVSIEQIYRDVARRDPPHLRAAGRTGWCTRVLSDGSWSTTARRRPAASRRPGAAVRGGAACSPRGGDAPGPRPGPRPAERGQPAQPDRPPDREGGRARPRAGPDRHRGRPRLVDLLEPEPQAQVREALSELQLLFAQASGGGPEGGPPAEGGEPGAPGGAEPPAGERQPPPQRPQSPPEPPSQGSGEAPSRLWTPHQRD